MMKYIILLSILINVLSYKSRPINYYKIPKYVERMFNVCLKEIQSHERDVKNVRLTMINVCSCDV